MAGIRPLRCGSWAEFKRDFYGELFGGEGFQEDRYLFRGMGSDAWHLESSFDRYAGDVPSVERKEQADRLLALFVDECATSDGTIEQCPAEPHALIALAQHHGLPTRGLDWTESPYVAGYFAFADAWSYGQADGRGQVAIWALDRTHPAWSGGNGVEIVTAGRAGNERMVRQRAALTYLHAAATELEEYVRAHPEDGDALVRFSLPKSDARVALADLAAMGITSTRLFPDREGAARAAKLRYAIRRAASDD
jgi:hypothetical protein